jgi:hypothetical protein
MAALAWYGERPAAEVRTALAAAGLELLPADRRSWQGVAQACIVACPPANEEALHASFAELPPLQELSFRLPAGRLLIWDPCGACAATVPTDIGMTGVARPAGPPSASDPWQLNDYALARWVHITAFLVLRPPSSLPPPRHTHETGSHAGWC